MFINFFQSFKHAKSYDKKFNFEELNEIQTCENLFEQIPQITLSQFKHCPLVMKSKRIKVKLE